MKPEDTKAASIKFGVELETVIPYSAGIDIGEYHRGHRVSLGKKPDGTTAVAPSYRGEMARAERDGSLMNACPSGYTGCEFVTPVLEGEEGLNFLVQFVEWIRSIGGKVTSDCGLHVHVGVRSVVGEYASPDDTVNYLCKLGAVCQRLGLAFYSQTGTARHTNRFCQPLGKEEKDQLDRAKAERGATKLRTLGNWQKYRLMNLRRINDIGTVEFRAFAGTLNVMKVLHHLATALGACRYAAVVRRAQWGVNTKNWWTQAGNGENALRLLWAVFGWAAASSSSTHAFGLHGRLYSEFATYSEMALKMARKFDVKSPGVVLSDTPVPTF